MQVLEISYAFIFLGGFYLAMATQRLILFMYNRNRRANLVYFIGMFMVFINFTFTRDPASWAHARKLNILTDLLANAALLYFVLDKVISYTLPRFKKIIRIYVYVFFAAFVLLALNSQMQIFRMPLEIILRSSIYAVTGFGCALGLVKRIPNFHLIVIATLILMVMWVISGADLFNFWDNEYPVIRVLFLVVGFMSPWFAYSNYQARYLSTTKKNLAKEQIINEQLSLINVQAEKIRELDQLKSRFFANISHEFRTPLTLLLGPIEKRLKQSEDPRDKMELTTMHRNASKLLTLVNQLLDLSRLEAGTLQLRCASTDLHAAALSVMSQFSSIADSKAISLEVRVTEPVYTFVDRDKFEKVISNLLSNAFKFTPAGGSITVIISKGQANPDFKSGYAEIIVADTGSGIEPEHLPKIFDRFYQADMSSTRAYEGSGIGLALTKELVELHHGRITVTSDAGQNCIFHVQLPLGSSHLKPEEIELNEELAEGTQGVVLAEAPKAHNGYVLSEAEILEKSMAGLPRILLVEDNQDLRHYLRENLQQQFNIQEAEEGQVGIAKAIQDVPDLIISDLMMPKANGLQLCQQLKEDERTSHIPIILLTAKADVETKLEGYRQGADDYIPKPFNMDELLTRIENLLANRKRIQEKYSRQMTLSPSVLPVTSVDERFLKKCLELVERVISDPTFGVELFAREMAVSQTQLYRKLHAITNLSPNEFIRHIRLLRAADLLRKKAGNVSDVAYAVGINNLSYFSKVFKEKFGITPVEFLKSPLPAEANGAVISQ